MIYQRSKFYEPEQQSSKNIFWKAIGQRKLKEDQNARQTGKSSSNNSKHQRYNPSHSKQKHQIKIMKQVALRSHERTKVLRECKTQKQEQKCMPKKSSRTNYQSIREKVSNLIDNNFKSKAQIEQSIERANSSDENLYLRQKVKKLQQQNKKVKEEFINFKKKIIITLRNQKQQMQSTVTKILNHHVKPQQCQSNFQQVYANSQVVLNKQKQYQTSFYAQVNESLKCETKKVGDYKNKLIEESKGNVIVKALQQAKQADKQKQIRKANQKIQENAKNRQKSFDRIFSVIKNLQQNINCDRPQVKNQIQVSKLASKQNELNEPYQINEMKLLKKSSILKNQGKFGLTTSLVSPKNNRIENKRIQWSNALVSNNQKQNCEPLCCIR